MKLILLSCFVLCGAWGFQAFDFFKKDIFKKPTSNQLDSTNEGGKNLKCWECTTNDFLSDSDDELNLCPDDFSNTTQLTQCDPGASFCMKYEAKFDSEADYEAVFYEGIFLYVCLCEDRYVL